MILAAFVAKSWRDVADRRQRAKALYDAHRPALEVLEADGYQVVVSQVLRTALPEPLVDRLPPGLAGLFVSVEAHFSLARTKGDVTETAAAAIEDWLAVRLELDGAEVTDCSLDALARVTRLKDLVLIDTSVSEEGILRLSRAQPHLLIQRGNTAAQATTYYENGKVADY